MLAIAVYYVPSAPSEKSFRRGAKEKPIDRLNEEQKRIYHRLAACRKIVADAVGTPIYNVMLNEEMARLAEAGSFDEKSMQRISDMPPARMKKYGQRLLTLYHENQKDSKDEAGGKSNTPDSGPAEPTLGLQEG